MLYWRQVQEQENEQTTGRQEKHFRRRVSGVGEEVKELPEHNGIGLVIFLSLLRGNADASILDSTNTGSLFLTPPAFSPVVALHGHCSSLLPHFPARME